MTATLTRGTAPSWDIRHELPGRLRLRCAALDHSEALRRHCRTVLTGCHWLEGFRINAIAGCLSLHFPPRRRASVDDLLNLALSLPPGFTALQSLNARQHRSPTTLRHGVLCAGLLGLDWLVGLPLLALQGAAALLMLPVVIDLLRTLRRERRLPSQALDLGFSAVLIQLGLPREALTDLALDDGSELLQELSHTEVRPADYRDLLERITEQVTVRTAGSPGTETAIGALQSGDRILLEANDPVFVPCRIQSGSVIAIQRQLTGDWHPHHYTTGDRLEPGCLVLSGTAELEVMQSFGDCPLFQLPPSRHGLAPPAVEDQLTHSLRIVNPLLFGLGSVWALSGASERALAAFQFNPVNDWDTSRTANVLAAVTELRLHGIQIANPDALRDLGRMQRLLVSQSCIERLQPLRLKEDLLAGSGLQRGELIRILAGLQRFLIQERSVPIWTSELETVDHPIAVKQVALHDLNEQGWQLTLDDGRELTVVSDSRHQQASVRRVLAVEPLEFRLGDRCLGWVNLNRIPNDGWLKARMQLEQLGIAVDVVGQAVNDPDESQRRLLRVEQHQAMGEVVGYLGDVIHDIPALARADIAIGLDFDEAGVLTNRLCDAALNREPEWLPRLVVLSRSLQRTANSNALLIGATHVLASLATAGLAISPLQTVLLADIPLLLAELHNLNSFQSHTRTR